MRFIIYGAGAIGGTLGARLAQAGYEVALVDLPGTVEAIRANGLRFVTPSGTHVMQLPVTDDVSELEPSSSDVVLLCVKSQDTEDALRKLSATGVDLPIFCLQNGVRNEELATQSFRRVYGVLVRGTAVCLRDGEVINPEEPPGVFIIGRFPEGVDELAESVAEAFRAGNYAALVVPDVMRYKWGKLLRNLHNSVRAITDTTSAETQAIARAAEAEAEPILKKAGVAWLSQRKLASDWEGLQRPVEGKLSIEVHSSTWQSLKRHEGSSEVGFLNGEIVRLAEQVGMAAPINSTLTRIVSDMAIKREEPGRHTPSELRELLGLR